jgi:NAD(P)-dependent dehydrogenase (short-subunit alcohol dehydrogenase family)
MSSSSPPSTNHKVAIVTGSSTGIGYETSLILARKDLALDQNLIYVGKKGAQDDEGCSDQAAYMALNKNLIEPLMDWKFINIEKIGARHVVSLTDEGINALRFLHEGRYTK